MIVANGTNDATIRLQKSKLPEENTTGAPPPCGAGTRPPKTLPPQLQPPNPAAPKEKASQVEVILEMIKKVLELISQLIPLFSKTPARTGEVRNNAAQASTPGAKPSLPSDSINGGGQFLWKPRSDKDGRLAILLPPNMTGKVSGVSVVSPAGEVIEKGSSGGVGNGGREHFRFRRQGADYPDGSIVRAVMNDGTSREIAIRDTAARFTA